MGLADNAMTLNTLRYVAPIKVGMKNRTKIVPNPKSPESWSNEKLAEWVKKESNGKINSQTLRPWESGKQFLSLPEAEILKRIVENNPKVDEEMAKDFYIRLWKLLIDARMKERKAKMKKKPTTNLEHPVDPGNEAPTDEEIERNNQLPELELVIETAVQISDQEFAEKVQRLDEVEEVKLFTVSYSEEENKQRFYMQIKSEYNRAYLQIPEEAKRIFRKTGVRPLYCDSRDVRSEDSKFVAHAKKKTDEVHNGKLWTIKN